MSENFPSNHEHQPTPTAERAKSHERESHEPSANEHDKKHGENLTHIQASVEKHAVSGQESTSKATEQGTNAQQPTYADKNLQTAAFDRTMVSVRKHLKKRERRFSKVIHQPVIDKVSTVAEKTVARPSPLLVGSISTLIVSSIFLYMSRHYGFTYNFTIMLAVLVIGYALGLVGEMLFRVIRRKPAR